MNKEQMTSAQDVSWENPSTGKTQQSLLEKICIMNPEYNHKPRLQPTNPDLDLTWTKPQAQIYKAKTQPVPNSALDPK
jgi:hypothetical protein